MPHIFISYAKKDTKQLAFRLKNILSNIPNMTAWMDDSLKPGGSWAAQIEAEIDRSQYVVVLLSPDVNRVPQGKQRRSFVQNEILYAQQQHIPIIPVMAQTTKLPIQLVDNQYIDFVHDEDAGIDKLIEEICQMAGLPKPPSNWQANLADNFDVPYIVPELIFLGKRALRYDQIRSELISPPYPCLPEQLQTLQQDYLHRRRKEAHQQGTTFDNNLSYSLHDIVVSRDQDSEGRRQRIYTLRICPTDYYNFVFPNLILDEPIIIQKEQTTLRHYLGMEHDKLRLENLSSYACHFKLGAGTVFITKDNRIVFSIRSHRQFVVGGTKYHLSAAEGVLRPVDEENGHFSPFLTSIRALEEELGLERDVDFATSDLRCLGFLIDTLRAQPFFIFYVRSQTIDFDTLKSKWVLEALDRHENLDIIGLPWNVSTAKDILDGKFVYQGTLLEAASNHAQSGFKLASLHEFGNITLNS